jgi:hypothetical protein
VNNTNHNLTIEYLLVELGLVVVDVNKLDGDDGITEPLLGLTLNSGASSNLKVKLKHKNCN